jgi:DNA-binding LacI/PurR family transcriptional regulator
LTASGSPGSPGGTRGIPTMRDVAAAVGVSQSTVSRVLSGVESPIPVTAATKDRILAAARDLGYRPNPLARGLRGARTMLLGVIVRDIMDPLYAGVLEALATAARSHGYNIVVGTVHGEADEAVALTAVLETRHCDAVVLVGDMRDQPGLMDEIAKTHVPTVAAWAGSRRLGIPVAGVDNRVGVREAVAYLLGLGHRRIAMIAGRRFVDFVERRTAWLETMAAHDLPVPARYCQWATNDPVSAGTAMVALMGLVDRPTAVIASTDYMAIGALHAATREGLRVPADVSIVGFDDLPISAHLNPGLTSVHMPILEIATIVVDEAIALVDRDERHRPFATRMVRPWLLVRDSCCPPLDSVTHSVAT